MIPLGKPVQQSPSFARSLTSDYDPIAKQIVASTLAAPVKSKYAKTSHFLPLYDEKLLHIEFHHKNITNPLTLIKYYYPTHMMVLNSTLLPLTNIKPSSIIRTFFSKKVLLKLKPSMINTPLKEKFSTTKLRLLNSLPPDNGVLTHSC